MKKISFLLAALAIMLAGCNKDENESNDETGNKVSQEAVPFVKGQKVTLTVTADAPDIAADTKTRVDGTISGKTLSFKWSTGDKLTVTVGEASAEFTIKSLGTGNSTATFEGTMPADGDTFTASFGPTSVPTSQTYNGSDKIPADAMYFKKENCTLGSNLSLTPQFSVLNLKFYCCATVKQIKVTPESGSTTYTLDCGSGVALGATKDAATPFYIVMPTGTYNFTVGIYDDTNTLNTSFTTTSTHEFTTAKYVIMSAKEVHGYVDLGLPNGTLWATHNVGASSSEGYGDYFAWGETTGYNSGKTTFDWSTYTLCNGSGTKQTKYCTQSSFGYNGFTDGKTVLEASDDAATANWGTGWCMPTKEEWQELIDNCTWTWTTVSGVNGYKVTSKKSGYTDKSVFLPAAGNYRGAYLYDAGSCGYYWSGSLATDDSDGAWRVDFYSDGSNAGNYNRYYGQGVRAVRAK